MAFSPGNDKKKFYGSSIVNSSGNSSAKKDCTIYNRQAAKSLLVKSVFSLIMRGVGAIASLIFMYVVAVQIGVTESGYFFLAMNVVLFISVVARLGLDNSIVRFTGAALGSAKHSATGQIRSVLCKSLLLVSLSGCLLMFALYAAADFISIYLFDKPELRSVLVFISPAVLGIALFTLVAMSLQGAGKVVPAIFVLNTLIFVLASAAVYLATIEQAFQVAGVYAGSALITLVIGGAIRFRTLPKGEGSVSWRRLFKSCMPLWLVAVMGQLTQLSGQFAAAAWVAPEELAQLATAQRTAMLISFILIAINFVVAPKFAALHQDGNVEGMRRLAILSVRLMILFSLPLLLPIMLFPEFIMSLFGAGFTEGAGLLQIFALGQFVNVVTGSVAFILSMSGHEKALRNCVLISGPLAIVLSCILVPVYGALGSAIATALAISLQNLLAVKLVNKHLGFNTLLFWQRG